jgi:hypothetical protein
MNSYEPPSMSTIALAKASCAYLRQIMPNAAWDGSVLIFSREFAGVCTRLGVWRLGIAFHDNR